MYDTRLSKSLKDSLDIKFKLNAEAIALNLFYKQAKFEKKTGIKLKFNS